MMECTVLSKEPVPNYIPQETEITRVTLENGGVAYCGPSGDKIPVNETELGFLILCWIDRLRSMVKLLDDENCVDFRENLDTLLKAFDRNVTEIMEAVYCNIGMIKCYLVGADAIAWREDRVVETELKPPIRQKGVHHDRRK